MTTYYQQEFDITSLTAVISATAGQKIKVMGIHMTNNSADGVAVRVRIISLTGGTTDYYGGAQGQIYLQDEQGQFSLNQAPEGMPYFEIETGEAMYISPQGVDGSPRISGVVLYYKE